MLRVGTIVIVTTLTAIMAIGLAGLAPPAPEVLTPIERINQGFNAVHERPLRHYSVAPKGDQIVPTPVKTLTCTKQFCEPHPKNLENLPEHRRMGIK